MRTKLLLFVALGMACIVPAVAQTTRFVKFPNGTRIEFAVPMGYSFEAKNNVDGSVRLEMVNPVWDIEIVSLVALEPDRNITKREWQENKLVTFISFALQRSQETDYVFHPLPVDKGSGVYCVFTSQGAAQAKPGEKVSGSHVTGGLKAWPGCVVVFVIISPDKSSPEYQEAIDLFSYGVTKTKG